MPLRHEVVPLVAQDADDLGGERLVEELDHGLAVGPVARGDRALLDVLARACAERLDVGEERLGHAVPSLPGGFILVLVEKRDDLSRF